MIRSALAVSVILALSISSFAGTSYIIANNNSPTANSVTAYKLNTGSGLFVVGGTVKTTGKGLGGGIVAVGQAITSDAHCLFAIDTGSNDIAAFASPSYKLVGKFSNSELNFSNYAGGTIAVSPNGNFLYGSYTGTSNIGAWQVNPNCSLTFIAAYVPSVGADAYSGLGVSPDGNSLVVSAPDFQAAESFQIGSNGSLTDVGFVSFADVSSCASAGCFPAAIDFTKDSKIVVFGNATSEPSVLTASLGTSGTLTDPQEWDLSNSQNLDFSNAVFLSSGAYAGSGFLFVGMTGGVVTATFTESPLSITTTNSRKTTGYSGNLAVTGNILVRVGSFELSTYRIHSDGSLTVIETLGGGNAGVLLWPTIYPNTR